MVATSIRGRTRMASAVISTPDGRAVTFSAYEIAGAAANAAMASAIVADFRVCFRLLIVIPLYNFLEGIHLSVLFQCIPYFASDPLQDTKGKEIQIVFWTGSQIPLQAVTTASG